MKGYIAIIVAAVIVFGGGLGVITFSDKVKQGQEGILVHNMGTGKGAIETLEPGRHWYNSIIDDLIIYPMQLQNVAWETEDPRTGAFTFNSASGLGFQADFGLAYRVQPGASGEIYRKYRKGLKEVTTIDMRNRFQDALNIAGSSRADDAIYGAGKTEFISEVKDLLQAEFSGLFIIEKVSLKGRMILPPTVAKGIEAKQKAIQAAQQRENEVAEQIAQRLKAKEDTDALAYDIERKARAEAKAIELVEKQLSKSPMYIEYLKATKWDGKLPQYTSGVPMMKITTE